MLLCLKCGHLKLASPAAEGIPAVLAPCDRCGFVTTDAGLDMAFSDAALTAEQLRYFGSVFQAIRKVSEDEVAVFWSFIKYVSSHHPEVLTRSVPAAHEQRVEAVYDKVEWPSPPAGGELWWK